MREALLAVCGPTRVEKGCINYDLHVSADQQGVLVFLENWVSKADLEAHMQSPHIAAFRATKRQTSSPSPRTSRCGARSKGDRR